MSFAIFREAEIVQDVIARSMQFDVTRCGDWVDYHEKLLASRTEDFVDRIRRFADVFSPSERCVLCAALAAADYVWLADEIAGANTWSMFDDCDQSTRRVIATAIARE